MERAVFLDRDGTINREVDHLRRIEQLRLLPGVAEALRRIRRMGYRIIIVTNQAAVARGLINERGVREIHRVLAERLRRQGAEVDAIYYCPHHPTEGSRRYRRACACRKPGTGLLRRGIKVFGIDSRKSFMVGDKTQDILTGKRAGMKTILVRTGYAGSDGLHEVTPDFTVRDLRAAAELIARRRGHQPAAGPCVGLRARRTSSRSGSWSHRSMPR